MLPSGHLLPRRAWLLRSALCGLAAAGVLPRATRAHDMLGPVTPPLPVLALPLTLHDGRSASLPAVLQDRITALQLMFTGCSAICPVQGAVFAELQTLVQGSLPKAQLLSLSIDPLSDDATALANWRKRFGAGAAWFAAAPPLKHTEAMQRFLEGSRSAAAARGGDRHSAQVYLFDKQGRLAYRCAEFASPRDIAAAMRALAAPA